MLLASWASLGQAVDPGAPGGWADTDATGSKDESAPLPPADESQSNASPGPQGLDEELSCEQQDEMTAAWRRQEQLDYAADRRKAEWDAQVARRYASEERGAWVEEQARIGRAQLRAYNAEPDSLGGGGTNQDESSGSSDPLLTAVSPVAPGPVQGGWVAPWEQAPGPAQVWSCTIRT